MTFDAELGGCSMDGMCQEQDVEQDVQMNPRLDEGASRAGILKDEHSSFGSLMGCTRLGFFRELRRVRKRQRGRCRRHSVGLNPVFALGGVKDLPTQEHQRRKKKGLMLEC